MRIDFNHRTSRRGVPTGPRRFLYSNKDTGMPSLSVPVSNGGYTLVEGIVASVIASILAGVLFTILSFNYESVKFGAVSAKVRSQYEIAITEIGTNTRNAYAVLNYEGGGETYPPASTLTQAMTSKIMMYSEDANGAGAPVRGFWVDDGQFKEWKPGWSEFKPYVVGGWSMMRVLDASPFQLSADRKTLTVSMRVRDSLRGATAIAPARGEVFICRN
jgi:hypothetical protein